MRGGGYDITINNILTPESRKLFLFKKRRKKVNFIIVISSAKFTLISHIFVTLEKIFFLNTQHVKTIQYVNLFLA